MAAKAGLPNTDATAEPEDAGAVDNRLSVVPDDFPAVKDWADGEEYDITELGEGTKLRQISPGEYEVLPGAAAEPEVEEEAPAKRGKGGYGNPAVQALADEA